MFHKFSMLVTVGSPIGLDSISGSAGCVVSLTSTRDACSSRGGVARRTRRSGAGTDTRCLLARQQAAIDRNNLLHEIFTWRRKDHIALDEPRNTPATTSLCAYQSGVVKSVSRAFRVSKWLSE
jgi:hypothetical protein